MPDTEITYTYWQAPDRDSPAGQSIDVNFTFDAVDESNARLKTLLQLDGIDSYNDQVVTQYTGQPITRARRWGKFFERMGLLYRDGDVTRLTELGKALATIEATSKINFRLYVAGLAISVLKKYQLKNPADEEQGHYPDDCDVCPYWCIWKAADELGGKLHWDELNRELMRVLRMRDLPARIERIRSARAATNYDPAAGGSADFPLEDRCYDESNPPAGKTRDGQVRDHYMTPWLKRAGFGGLLLALPGQSGEGYWTIPDDIRPILQNGLEEPPHFIPFSDEKEWHQYYGRLEKPTATIPYPKATVTWTADIQTDITLKTQNLLVIRAALQSGHHVILIGPPGTGKTTLAEDVARALRGPNAYRIHTATSDWTSYEVVGGYRPDPAEPNTLVFQPGLITQAIADDAWVILDEINRADVDKAFGELFTLLSGRDVRLPFASRTGDNIILRCHGIPSDHEYVMQSDWRLIGTMNSFDKASLYQMSYAFMRRFAFIDIPIPEETQYREILAKFGMTIQLGEQQRQTWLNCNDLAQTLFANIDTGLHHAGLPVGPAIPLAALRHIEARLRTAPALLPPNELLLEALKLYLFPQFEGFRAQQTMLAQAIITTLAIESQTQQDDIRRTIALWTGATITSL